MAFGGPHSFKTFENLLTNIGLIAALLAASSAGLQGSLTLDDNANRRYRSCLLGNPEFRTYIHNYLVNQSFPSNVDYDFILGGPLNISDALLSTQGSVLFNGQKYGAIGIELTSGKMVLNRVFVHTLDSVPRAMKMCSEPDDMLAITSVLCLLVVCSASFVYAGLQFYTKGNDENEKVENTIGLCLAVLVVLPLYLITVVAIFLFGWGAMEVAAARDPGMTTLVQIQQTMWLVFLVLFAWFIIVGTIVPCIWSCCNHGGKSSAG